MAQNVYDNRDFFAGYSKLKRQKVGLDGAPEWPTLQAMLPRDLANHRVVDLGCGFGWFSRWSAQNGAEYVLGLDLSERMLEQARSSTTANVIEYQRADLDEITLESSSYSLAFSSLALHYVRDLERLLQVVFDSLEAAGQLLFSVEHPIFSAPTHQQFQELESGTRVWPLDNYLVEGERSTTWFTDNVLKQHRTVATYLNAVIDAGFVLDRVSEFGLTDEPDDAHRPWFLLVRATRP